MSRYRALVPTMESLQRYDGLRKTLPLNGPVSVAVLVGSYVAPRVVYRKHETQVIRIRLINRE
jgi:hypothetical protein